MLFEALGGVMMDISLFFVYSCVIFMEPKQKHQCFGFTCVAQCFPAFLISTGGMQGGRERNDFPITLLKLGRAVT